jgi:prepilin peptidase CpaA
MSFSMLFCIVFTMGAVFFDCKWEKVPNLWIIAGLQISMAEHLSGEVIQGLGSAVIRFWGGIFLVLFLFFPLFLGKMIGTGDIKVLAVLGSVLGPRKILFCIVTAFLLGAIESLFLLFFSL